MLYLQLDQSKVILVWGKRKLGSQLLGAQNI